MHRTSGCPVSNTLAVSAGKLSAFAIRLIGLGLASNLPGRIAGKISSGLLADLAAQATRGVIAVTGTNGKSTTSGLVASILRQEGLKIVHNKQGANLLSGITSCLVDASGWYGKLTADYCLFEIDEAALPLVAKSVPISAVLVTNLFRDQLDRFGELDTTAKLIKTGILENQSLAVLNADDPNVAQMVPECRRVFYGIRSLANDVSASGCVDTQNEAMSNANLGELSYCPSCGKEYEYAVRFYGQIGQYHCAACGNRRPQPEIFADKVSLGIADSSFVLGYGQDNLQIQLPLPGMFNVYNALAAAALCSAIGISSESVRQGLCQYSTLFGRSERIQLSGKTVLIQLIKNPAGASQAIKAAALDPKAQLLIAINDNYADGRDVSWLWDAEFEHFGNCAGPFVVSGKRCYDMAVRLKYAGVASTDIIVEADLDSSLDKALELLPEDKTLWILPTYTCLLELQKIMKARGCALSGT